MVWSQRKAIPRRPRSVNGNMSILSVGKGERFHVRSEYQSLLTETIIMTRGLILPMPCFSDKHHTMRHTSLILLSIALLLPACGPSAEQFAAEAKARRLSNEVTELKMHVDGARAEQRQQEESLGKAAAENRTLTEQLHALEKQLEAARKKSDEQARAYEEYKAKYKTSLRQKLIGSKLVRLTSTDGRVFSEVSIMQVTPGAMKFRHTGGIGTLPLGELDAAIRERAAYDPEEASAWLIAEQEKSLAFVKEKEDEPETSLDYAAATAADPSAGLKEKRARTASQLKACRDQLSELIAMGHRLKADRDACPIYKRSQLDAWGQQASRLRAEISRLAARN